MKGDGDLAGRTRNEEEFYRRKCEIMETCFECYAENGFHGTGVKMLAEKCGCTAANLYVYFENIDELVMQSTEHCMKKVEDDFLQHVPLEIEDLESFIEEIPHWTKEKHGKNYRLMYQIYTHPQYREAGKKFFKGVDERYMEYAKMFGEKINIPHKKLTALIFILIRACVHYALFEDEFYLKSQIEILKECINIILNKYSNQSEMINA